MGQFCKPARTYDEQIAILESRGMTVADRAFAVHCLTHYNYYRLSIYGRSFFDKQAEAFKPGTRFEDVWELYCFDRDVRRLVNRSTKRVEISLRSRWAYELGHELGPFGYEDSQNFSSQAEHLKAIEKLDDQLQRSHEAFVAHFKQEYGLDRPPIWAVCEVMTFGTFSKLFGLVKDLRIAKRVAATYNYPEAALKSAAHHLAYVRNLSAHHLRLWNRRFVITPTMPLSYPRIVVDAAEVRQPLNRKLYNTLVVLAYLCAVIDRTTQCRDEVVELIRRCPNGWLSSMGVPSDWQKRALWTAGSIA